MKFLMAVLVWLAISAVLGASIIYYAHTGKPAFLACTSLGLLIFVGSVGYRNH